MLRIIKLILIFSIIGNTGCKDSKPPKPIDLNELTISEIHHAYISGSYNSQQLVSAYLERIEKYDGQINSISIVNPEATIIAEQLDLEFERTNKLRPLHGIPIIVKDNINTKGLPTTGGSLALKDFIPDENAFIIQKLVDAGAIIIAKSNMAEWAFSAMHTESSTHGTTRNPYNLDHVPAGSSGGTAAAIASNFATIGLGTDTGNSIRGPSSHCALVGFRTTLGLVSRSAIIPLILRNDVAGPMGRTVEDATRILEIIAGVDSDDPLTEYSRGQSTEYQQYLLKDGLQGARLGVLREISEDQPDMEISVLFEQSISDLDSLGAHVMDIVVPDFSTLKEEQWCAEFREDLELYLANYVKRDSLSTLEDIIDVGTNSNYTEERLLRYAQSSGRFGDKSIECQDAYLDVKRIAFREAIEKVMDSLNLDAIVYPTWNNKPARIDFFEEEYQGDNNQIVAPHTGQPAFTVPMGVTKVNLPVGLQFLGRMYDESTLIKLSYAYEQGTKHRLPPIVTTGL